MADYGDGVADIISYIAQLELQDIQSLQSRARNRSSAANPTDEELALTLFAEEAEGLLNVAINYKNGGASSLGSRSVLEELEELEEAARYDHLVALAISQGNPIPPRPARRNRANGLHMFTTAVAMPADYESDETTSDSSSSSNSSSHREHIPEEQQQSDRGESPSPVLARVVSRPPFLIGHARPSQSHTPRSSHSPALVDRTPSGSYRPMSNDKSPRPGSPSPFDDRCDSPHSESAEICHPASSPSFPEADDYLPLEEEEETYAAYRAPGASYREYEPTEAGPSRVQTNAVHWRHRPLPSVSSHGAITAAGPKHELIRPASPEEAPASPLAEGADDTFTTVTYAPIIFEDISDCEPPSICTICGDEAQDFYTAPCSHDFDMSCLEDMFRRATHDESLYPPKCCQRRIPIEDVLDDLEPSTAAAFLAKATEYETRDRVYCHKPRCSAFLGSAASQSAFAYDCPKCSAGTCAMCKAETHPTTKCSDTRELNELATDMRTRQGWQRCYSCGHLVEKFEGCHHITCSCSAQFCYLCAVPWKRCSCPQFDVPPEVEEMNAPVQVVLAQG